MYLGLEIGKVLIDLGFKKVETAEMIVYQVRELRI